jgi:hypothetical protein
MNESYGIIQMFFLFSLLHVLYTLKDDPAPFLYVGNAESSHPSFIQLKPSSSEQ